MKLAGMTLAGFLVGALVCAAALQGWWGGRLRQATAECDRARADREKALSEGRRLSQRVSFLEQENARLSARVQELEAAAELFEEQDEPYADEPPEESEPVEKVQEAAAAQAPPTRGSRRDWGRGPWQRPGGDGSAPDQAQRQAWAQTFRQSMRENMDAFFQREIGNTTDPEVQNRLGLIQEHSNYAMELQEAMRQAESDEERQALREALRNTMFTLRDLGLEQQDHMLRELAREYGITDAARQDAFMASVRSLESSPYFRPEAAFPGQGMGFRGRGPGTGPRGR